MSTLSLWDRVKLGSRTGFERSWKPFEKSRHSLNRQSTSGKLNAEALWPTSLDKECDKAARILKSFCIDAFNDSEDQRLEDGSTQTQTVLKKVPASVIRDAKALAIFTSVRNGLWLGSGAGGSGVLIAQKDDGSWSPPSAILVHTAALGFLPGVDIYDCVVVINTQEAFESFYNVRYTLGSDVDIEAGPLIAPGRLISQIHQRQAPILTYTKCRGYYTTVQIDGTIVIERGDENEHFYGQRVSVGEIVNGRLQHPRAEVRRLLETLKAAQGDTHFDASALPRDPPPSDYEVSSGQVFGLPDKTDPDPYGVLALEKEGLRIVEAGSKERASWDQFSFCPSPTSPVHSIYARSNADHGHSFPRGTSWRGSSTSSANQTFIRPHSIRKSTDSRLRISTNVRSSTEERLSSDTPSSAVLTWRNGLDRQSSRTSTTPSLRPMRPLRDSVMEDDFFDKDASLAPTPSAYLTPPSTPPSERQEQSVASHGELAKHGVQVLSSGVAPIVAKAILVDIPKRSLASTPPHSPEHLSVHKSRQPSPPLDHQTESGPQTGVVDPIVAALLASEGKAVHDMMSPDQSPTSEPSAPDVHRHTSKNSHSSSTWERIRALRAIDDDE